MAFVTAPVHVLGVTTRRLRALCSRASTRVSAAPAMALEPLNADSSLAMKANFEVTVGKKAAVCRCWKSKKHPLCDGSHGAYNKETGSSIGPLVVNAAPAEK
jgi:CDGSH-type Zn-finger protein